MSLEKSSVHGFHGLATTDMTLSKLMVLKSHIVMPLPLTCGKNYYCILKKSCNDMENVNEKKDGCFI